MLLDTIFEIAITPGILHLWALVLEIGSQKQIVNIVSVHTKQTKYKL